MTQPIRTLIADDSETFRTLVREVLHAEGGFVVVAEAADGAEAVALANAHRPDLVVMDVRMPRMDGFVATRRIMAEAPTAIVVVTAHATSDVQTSLDALAAGALSMLAKPAGPASAEWARERARFVRTLRSMAEVKVVRRWHAGDETPGVVPPPASSAEAARVTVVGIVASTGGPGALRHVLSALPDDFAPPILVVQHIADGFVEGFAQWLDGKCALTVRVARDGEPLEPATVYVAPTDRHLGVCDWSVVLSSAPPVDGFRPSGTHLFRSLGAAGGPSAAGVILTGMGRDGVDGLRELRAAGGRVIAQDEQSCIVFGMPAAAIEAGVCDDVLHLNSVAAALVRYSCA